MSELILTVGASASSSETAEYEHSANTSLEVQILGAVLILLQLIDGVLTSLGVQNFGIDAEGNPLLRIGMELWGTTTTLFIAKASAIVVIFMLMRLSRQVGWVPLAMRCVVALYLVAAVIPWTIIHTRHYLF